MATIVYLASLLLLTAVSFAQQAETPVYKNGDWWKIKINVQMSAGISNAGVCDGAYSAYLVKVEAGKKRVYGLKNHHQEELDCPNILNQLLDIAPPGQPYPVKYLDFPLTVTKKWSARIPQDLDSRRGPRNAATKWLDLEFNVAAWEKVKTPKGTFDAFKIQIAGWPGKKAPTYFYSPEVKAIVRLREQQKNVVRIVTLIDCSVAK